MKKTDDNPVNHVVVQLPNGDTCSLPNGSTALFHLRDETYQYQWKQSSSTS